MLKASPTWGRILIIVGLAVGAFASPAQARDQIKIVGSSTVFPFSTAVAEKFARSYRKFKAPVVESTGSGGGLKLFCAGLGVRHPDITNASRRIKTSEIKRCAKNGVTKIIEIKIGYDGIVLANSKKSAQMKISLRHLYLALAKVVPEGGKEGGKLVPNPYKRWSQIDPSLPNVRIEVLGPPPTSGTRDAFVELAMENGCKTFAHLNAIKKREGKRKFKAVCHGIREDGHWIDAGENDNLIVQKLEANPNAFGVFGYGFLDQNDDKVQGAIVGGTSPTFENIAAQKYPVSRSMYFYVKKAHVGRIPGIKEYLAEFTSEKAWGPDGYLGEKGLIPMPKAERARFRNAGKKLQTLRD